MKKQFLLCGFTGWCLEVLWTGLLALLAGDATMTGKTSLLMFPIYGCASLIGPVSRRLRFLPLFFRGCVYTLGIFCAEFAAGSLLRALHMCPWDYSRTPFHYRGLIRFDYAPVWFVTGIIFEKILAKSS